MRAHRKRINELNETTKKRLSSRNDRIARLIHAAGQLHALLLHEALEQRVELFHDFRVAVYAVFAVFADGSATVFLYVSGNDDRKHAAQVRRQLVDRLVLVNLQSSHVLVSRLEGELEGVLDIELPVEEEGVVLVFAVLRDFLHARIHGACDFDRIIDDDSVLVLGLGTKRGRDEVVDLAEVGLRFLRPGQYQRKWNFRVCRIQQYAKDVQDLFGGADAAGEHHDAMPEPDECLQALLNVRHDDQLIDNRVGRFCRDDSRLGNAHVSVEVAALLAVRDGCALHRALHRAGTTSGADVHSAQAQFIANLLGVLVFDPIDGVTTPADDQIGFQSSLHCARVAEDREHGLGDAAAAGSG